MCGVVFLENSLSLFHTLLTAAFLIFIVGYNSLHHAVQYNQTLVSHYLISFGVFVDSRDNEGHTPLMWAAYLNFEESVRYLISQGAEINATDNAQLTALHWSSLKGAEKSATELVRRIGEKDRKKTDVDLYFTFITSSHIMQTRP
jgi:ankyrin repeat protein